MAKPSTRATRRRSRRVTWLLVLLLLASIYAFWVLPNQRGPRRIAVDFDSARSTNQP